MPRLTPIELEDGTTILIEATEDAIAPSNMKITVECSFPKKTENTAGVPPV